MATVAVIFSRKFRARVKVCPDMVRGVELVGDKVIRLHAEDYREPVSDVALFYGFDGTRASALAKVFEDYKSAGLKAVYCDLGYFSRRWKGDRYGYHRFSINARHPNAYFQNVIHPSDRFDVHNVGFETWRGRGKNILVCGMSQKCAEFDGFSFEQWERDAIAKIKSLTDRPIVYRPKPRKVTDTQYPPIEGVAYSDPSKTSIGSEIRSAWAVVSHHSNCGIDALLAGVPVFQDDGVAKALGADLSRIENPYVPSDDERRQWAYDVAYCQFNRAEMRDGTMWRHFKNEGLVP